MKKCKLLLALSISLLVPFFALTDVKAMTQVRPEVNKTLTWNGVSVGWYNHYAYLTSGSSEVINTSQFGVGPVGYYKTVDVITVGFNDPYSGELMLGFTGSLSNYQLVYIDGENTGSYRWSGSNQVLYVSFDNCLSFDIYMYSTTQYTNANLPTKIDVYAFTELSLYSAKIGSSYSIPIESLSAYMFPCDTLPELSFEHGDLYPSIHIDSNDQATDKSKMLGLSGSYSYDPIYWVFMCKQVIYDTSYSVYKSNNTSTDYLETLLQLYPRTITGTNTDEYFFVYRFSYYGTGSIQMLWDEDLDIIPIYLGHKRDCPSRFYSICGFGGDPVSSISGDMTEISNMIDQILTILTNNSPPDNYDQDIMDDAGDAIGGINLIESDFMDDFSDSFSDINLNNYTISSDLNNTVVWLTHNMTEIFSHSGGFQILYTLPLILGIALFFIGRGAVVFRQGNIDRAEFRQDLRNYNAQSYADKIADADPEHSHSFHVAEDKLANNKWVKKH